MYLSFFDARLPGHRSGAGLGSPAYSLGGDFMLLKREFARAANEKTHAFSPVGSSISIVEPVFKRLVTG